MKAPDTEWILSEVLQLCKPLISTVELRSLGGQRMSVPMGFIMFYECTGGGGSVRTEGMNTVNSTTCSFTNMERGLFTGKGL